MLNSVRLLYCSTYRETPFDKPQRIQIKIYEVKISFLFSFSWSVLEFLQEWKLGSLYWIHPYLYSWAKAHLRVGSRIVQPPSSSPALWPRSWWRELYAYCYLILQWPTLWKNSLGSNLPDYLRETGLKEVTEEVKHWEKHIRIEKEKNSLKYPLRVMKQSRHSQATATPSMGRVGRNSENRDHVPL